jgi:hypothetical protein
MAAGSHGRSRGERKCGCGVGARGAQGSRDEECVGVGRATSPRPRHPRPPDGDGPGVENVGMEYPDPASRPDQRDHLARAREGRPPTMPDVRLTAGPIPAPDRPALKGTATARATSRSRRTTQRRTRRLCLHLPRRRDARTRSPGPPGWAGEDIHADIHAAPEETPDRRPFRLNAAPAVYAVYVVVYALALPVSPYFTRKHTQDRKAKTPDFPKKIEGSSPENW